MSATSDLQELKLGDKMLSYIHFNSKVRDFVKERADLEREYARKLDSLVKRYTTKKELVSDGKGVEMISTKEAWQKIVKDTVEHSKLHSNLADTLLISVADRIKMLTIRKDDARKKNLNFINRFKEELERMEGDLEKCKTDYFMACDLVEASKIKYEKATDEKYKDKYQKLWHQAILDMNNQKNIYILTIETYNKMKQRQVAEEIPSIIKQVEEFGCSNNASMIKIWNTFLELQSGLVRGMSDVISGGKSTLDSIDPSVETNIELRASFFVNNPKVFEGCGLWTDEPSIQKDNFSTVYMGNKLERLRKVFAALEKDITKRKAGLEGLQKLYQSFLSNPLAGDAEIVKESIEDENRFLFILEQTRFKYNTFMDLILTNIGEFSANCRMHKFKSSMFAMPTRCDYCQFTIWGMSKGITCKDCTFNAHIRCEMKLAPNCSGIKGKIDSRKQRSVSDPYHRSMSNFSRATSISMIGIPRYEMHSVYEEQPRFKVESIMEPLRIDNVSETIPSTPTPVHLESISVSDYSDLQSEMSPRARTPVMLRMSPAPTFSVDLEIGNLAEVIYDYYATHAEEMNIHEGEYVRVERLDDGSGWTLVSKSGLAGIVPTAYIKGRGPSESFSTLRQNSQHLEHGMATVLYSFTKSDSSELSVFEGSTIRVIKEDDGSGWILATDGKSQGLIPANYVQPL